MSLKRYNGSSWVDVNKLNRHNGSSYTEVASGKRYDGSSWKEVYPNAKIGFKPGIPFNGEITWWDKDTSVWATHGPVASRYVWRTVGNELLVFEKLEGCQNNHIKIRFKDRIDILKYNKLFIKLRIYDNPSTCQLKILTTDHNIEDGNAPNGYWGYHRSWGLVIDRAYEVYAEQLTSGPSNINYEYTDRNTVLVTKKYFDPAKDFRTSSYIYAPDTRTPPEIWNTSEEYARDDGFDPRTWNNVLWNRSGTFNYETSYSGGGLHHYEYSACFEIDLNSIKSAVRAGCFSSSIFLGASISGNDVIGRYPSKDFYIGDFHLE